MLKPARHRFQQLMAKTGYNSSNAPHIGNVADGSVQLFADQSRGVRIGPGFETSGVLPARWKASLRHDGDAIGIAVRPLRAAWQMPSLHIRGGHSNRSGRKLTWIFPGDLSRIPQSFSFPPRVEYPLPKFL
jgi:hypothetical protein